MAEYIDREAVIEKFRRMLRVKHGTNERFFADSVFAIIENFPAADVVPVQHGEWENGNPICPVCGEDKFKGLDADIWCDWQPDYCPNCGAKMDEEAKNERKTRKKTQIQSTP